MCVDWEIVETWPESLESQKGQKVTPWGLECLAEALGLQAGNGKLLKGVFVVVQRNNTIKDDFQAG